jgi:excisionase family DNA binding protein
MRNRRRRSNGQAYDPNALLKKTRLRIDEASALLDVHADTVRRWLVDGKLTGIRTPGGQRRIYTVSVRKYM